MAIRLLRDKTVTCHFRRDFRLMWSEPIIDMVGKDDDRTFAPSNETTARWRIRQRALLVSVSLIGVVTVVRAITDPKASVVVVATVFVMIAWILGYTFYRRSPTHLPQGSWWAGSGSLSLIALRQAGLAGGIHVKSERRLRFWTQGRAVVGGRLEVVPDGLHLQMRFLSRLIGVTGSVLIPWASIHDVQVGDIPGKINRGLGGGFAVTLKAGGVLDGQFLGPRPALLTALKRSPLAR